MNVLTSVMNITAVAATMPFGERMKVGLLGTLSGMLIVFVALLIIAAILSSFKYLNKHVEKKEKAKIKSNPKPVVEQPVEAAVEQQDDLELVAVITAAIAASLNTSSDRLKVRSLRRINGNKSAWNAASRQENIQNNI